MRNVQISSNDECADRREDKYPRRTLQYPVDLSSLFFSLFLLLLRRVLFFLPSFLAVLLLLLRHYTAETMSGSRQAAFHECQEISHESRPEIMRIEGMPRRDFNYLFLLHCSLDLAIVDTSPAYSHTYVVSFSMEKGYASKTLE